MLKDSYALLKERISLQLKGKVTSQEVSKILNTFAQVIEDKARDNEPVKVKGIGTFGIASWKYTQTVPKTRKVNGKVLRPSNNFKKNRAFASGVNRYKIVFRPSKFFNERVQ